MHRLGFGFTELGTLTPLPQLGNPRPRLFRLEEDSAVINRMGFNNGGQAAAIARLERHGPQSGLTGINIEANKDAADRQAEYASGVGKLGYRADSVAIKRSSPHT